MLDINETFERMIAEMQRHGATPAPNKGGSYNNLLRYREAREKILDRFLAAFADGYRLGKEDAEAGVKGNNVPTNEPLTIEQLREMDGEPVYIVIDGVEPLKMWVLVEIDGADIYLTNNFGGRSSYEEVKQLYKFNLYRRPPERQED